MTDAMRNEFGAAAVVDRNTFQAEPPNAAIAHCRVNQSLGLTWRPRKSNYKPQICCRVFFAQLPDRLPTMFLPNSKQVGGIGFP